jgi:DNA-binding CsgD family transcriptional regulator
VVGRDAELGEVLAVVAGECSASVVVLEGEAGIGKTVVWEEALERSRALVRHLLIARPTEAEATSSYAALGDLLTGVADDVHRLPEIQRRALAEALGLEQVELARDPRLVGMALISLLGGLATGGRVLIAVDDWQWLDAPSRVVLDYAIRRLPSACAVMATARIGSGAVELGELFPGLSDDRIVDVALAPLEARSLAGVIRSRLGVSLAPAAADRLRAETNGNPLTAVETVRAERSAQLPGARDVRHMLAARLRAASEPARAAVRVVAAMSRPDAAVLERVVGSPALEAALLEDLVIAVDANVRTGHPLLATVARELTPPARWRALHRTLADVVADAEQRARHLAEATEGPDEAVAQAVEAAAARAAASSAAELYETAARLTPGSLQEHAARRDLAAADVMARIGDGGRARSLLSARLERLAAGPTRARVLCRLANLVVDDSGPRLLDQALEEAGRDDVILAEIHLMHANNQIVFSGAAAAMPHVDAALRCAERSGRGDHEAEALVHLAFCRFSVGEGIQRDVLARAAKLEDETGNGAREMPARTLLAMHLFQSGALDDARTAAETELTHALHRGLVDVEGQLRWILAELEVRAGRLSIAAEHAERNLELGLATDINNAEAVGRWSRGLVRAHLGDVAGGRADALRALELSEAMGDEVFALCAASVLGFLGLATGDPVEAVRRLGPLPAREAALGVHEPMVYGYGPDLIEALVLTGELQRATAVCQELDERSRRLSRDWGIGVAARSRAVIAAAEQRLDDAVAEARAAVQILSAIGQPLEHARALLVLGSAQRRAKRRGEARASLDAAFTLAQQVGEVLYAQRIDEERRRLGGRRAQDRDELTPTERRIAEEVAAGHSNREVAAALFVAERTVEANLTRIYRKLGVRSRSQLARVLR